ncbi:MAG: septum site-determining protein MinC [Aggregatibacter aphrophilus]|jgi:septum site-determining protein minC|uniref:septum site-determining protein MinC n=1 Tax=Aggregatibacter aphrophilus TaxID=732 RepID=UPI000D6431EA|nr:septum site-determining protein MinC [Aggregatibacter aphrophilus]MDU7785615.1 septum site-determining protein MinC [Aggregatibacter aphrophilus]
MAQDIIELRTGQFSAVFISINSSSLTAIKRALTKKTKNTPSLFNNIEVILQFNPMLEKVNLIALKELLAEHNIHLIGVADWQNNLQRELILAANLPILGKIDNISEILPEPRYLPTKIVPHNVIDKQIIYAKNSDLIIHGDVEHGAEVAADGNIHIYGELLGRAMAGVNSSSGSIYTQYLDAEFVAVNSRFLYKEKIPTEFLYRSVRIFAEKDKLIFTPF